jgi:molybdopterin/thiamine biosynthesis adenylyltransferase
MTAPFSTASRSAHLTALIEASRGVLVLGLGGLASPALSVLVKSGVTRFTLVDDDSVDVSNLQRQTLYRDEDVGRLKVDVAAERLSQLSPSSSCLRWEKVVDRFAPENALELAQGHVLILEGADNFATKFLAADAAKLAHVPIAQAGAVRFSGWALAAQPEWSACLRCVFEDIPQGMPETCAAAGVLGPVVGVLGALQAGLSLGLLLGKADAAGTLFGYEALAGRLRRRSLKRRNDCPLCSGIIRDLNPERYFGACAA